MVVLELAEQLRVVPHYRHHDPPEGPVVLNSGVLSVRIRARVLERRILRHHGRDIHRDQLVNPVSVLPLDPPEQAVELLDNH